MSPASTSVFYGFASLCLGLIALAETAQGLPTALKAATGFEMTPGQLGTVELLLLAATAFMSVLFVVNGVATGITDGRRPHD